MTETERAISSIEKCRDIHEKWITYIANTPGCDTKNAGGTEWHQEWVERYDQVLTVLRGLSG
jgi:hypothetical protein